LSLSRRLLEAVLYHKHRTRNASLQNLIVQQDTRALDKPSKQNLKRHLQKSVKAFQTSSAQAILKDDQIQFLTTINNEAKVRRSTRPWVLAKGKGEGKVISPALRPSSIRFTD
jgi:hypothetical protein